MIYRDYQRTLSNSLLFLVDLQSVDLVIKRETAFDNAMFLGVSSSKLQHETSPLSLLPPAYKTIQVRLDEKRHLDLKEFHFFTDGCKTDKGTTSRASVLLRTWKVASQQC
ncbi:hypothetical protein AVEN_185413-1 [Araneus ventricosus]|uniref:Uncharacterized protein n=1 Tax=Araneus ventricosus TaxID=182803 RepID=A0A4Y2CJJ2_ARAVE|nr:hypothetical protein AVEN_185413-1 [Araneus ventricosus]